MTMIYHITTRGDWLQAQEQGTYKAASLLTEGFIHCSTAAQVVAVANTFYGDVPDLVLLGIDTDELEAPVKWEVPADPDAADTQPAPDEPLFPDDDTLFPHVYGDINLGAVTNIHEFPKNSDGDFTLPPALRGDNS